VNLRAVVEGAGTQVSAQRIESGGGDASAAAIGRQTVFMDDRDQEAVIFDRSKLKAGNVIVGPAIVVEMDSTSLVLSGHSGTIDEYGNIIIRPVGTDQQH
jgi:N-methylhydantoinase A